MVQIQTYILKNHLSSTCMFSYVRTTSIEFIVWCRPLGSVTYLEFPTYSRMA